MSDGTEMVECPECRAQGKVCVHGGQRSFSDDFNRSSLGPAWGVDDGGPVTSGMPFDRSTLRPEGGPDASQREAMARVLGSVTARGGDGGSAHGELAAHVERLLRDPAVVESLSADQLRKIIAALDTEGE